MDSRADHGRLGRDFSKPGRVRPPSGRGDWRRRLAVAGAGVAAMVAVLVFAYANPLLFDRLRNIVFDGYQRLAPRPEAGAPLTFVDIDEASIGRIGQWPWPRTTLATMVDRLGQLGASTIAFDMVFSEADRTSPQLAVSALEQQGAKIDLPSGLALDNDAVLAKAFAANPVVAGIAISDETAAQLPPPKAGFAFGGADPKTYLPPFTGGVDNLSSLSGAAQGMGFFSFPPSADGVVRSLPLVASAQGKLYPALSVEALRLAQGASSFVIRSTGASGEEDTGRPAMTAFKDGALAMPTGPDGAFDIYYSGLPDMPTIPAATLLDPKASAALADKINGRIVIVGTSAVGLRDLVATPLATAVPGARVHAEVIDQIIGQVFLSRPDWLPGAEVAMAGLAGLVVLLLEAFTGVILSTIGTLVAVALIIGASWWAFISQHLLLDPLLASLSAAAVFAATTPVLLLWTDREKRFINSAFGRYLSPELVGRLAANPSALKLGGEMRDLTVLFCDIRNFTALSENLKPDELTRRLNNFLTPATDVLLRGEATIDKYMGDAIMAFWNAPLAIADHRRKACLAALDLLGAVEALNRREGLDLRVGVGLNAGECLVGNLGSQQRFSYSAIGDAVNVASRVEGLTKQYHVSVLVTEAVRADVSDLAFIEADRVRVVGRAQPIALYALVGDTDYAGSPAFAGFAAAHARLIAGYRDLDFGAATEALARARELAPPGFQEFYEVYSQRLEAMRLDPPAKDSDRVFETRQK